MHALSQYDLPGIGPSRLEKLAALGILNLEELVAADVAAVADTSGIPTGVLATAIDVARQVLVPQAAALAAAPVAAAAEPVLVEDPTPIDHVLADLRAVRRAAKGHPRGKQARETRRQLRRLRDRIDEREADGEIAPEALLISLQDVHALLIEALSEPELKKRHLAALADAARTARKRLKVPMAEEVDAAEIVTLPTAEA